MVGALGICNGLGNYAMHIQFHHAVRLQMLKYSYATMCESS